MIQRIMLSLLQYSAYVLKKEDAIAAFFITSSHTKLAYELVVR